MGVEARLFSHHEFQKWRDINSHNARGLDPQKEEEINRKYFSPALASFLLDDGKSFTLHAHCSSPSLAESFFHTFNLRKCACQKAN